MFCMIFGSMGHATAFSGPDQDRLKSTLFDISGRQLTLPLPTKGLSSDIDQKPFVTSVDLDNLRGQDPLMMVDELWDWHGSFWQGVAGSLRIKVSVRNAPDGTSLRCEESLRQMLIEKFEHEKEEFEKFGGNPKYMWRYELEPTHRLQQPALFYRERGQYIEDSYFFPVTDRAYVRLGFIFERNGDDKKWIADAMALEMAILGKMHINGNWLHMEPCKA